MKHQKQRGLTTLGWLIALAVGGFFISAGLTVGPLYLDNSFVKASLDSMAGADVHAMTNKQIRRKISDFFNVNNVRDVPVSEIEITRDKTQTTINIDYEKRVNFMANVDVVVSFNNQYISSK